MLNLQSVLTIIPQREETSVYYKKILQTINLESFEVNSSWDNQTQTGKVTLSRKNKGWLIFDANKGYQNQKNNTTVKGDYANLENTPEDVISSDWSGDVAGWIQNFVGTEQYSNLYLNNLNYNLDNTNFSGFPSPTASTPEPLVKVGDFIALSAFYYTLDVYVLGAKIYTKSTTKLDGFTVNLFRNFLGNDEKGGIYKENTDTEIGLKVRNNGYFILDTNSMNETDLAGPRSQLIYGYVTAVQTDNNGKTVISIADYMYYINQLIVKNATYKPNKWTIMGIFKDLYDDALVKNEQYTNDTKVFYSEKNRIKLNSLYKDNNGKPEIFTINDRDMKAGTITTEVHPTMNMFLKYLKSNVNCQPFFYLNSNVLNILPYRTTTTEQNINDKTIPSIFGYQQHYFCFQENIISHSLEFRRKEDKIIGARVKAFRREEFETENANGVKTVRKKPYTIVVDPGGDMIDINYLSETDPNTIPEADLKKLMRDYAFSKLKKINYSGYYGSFTTFGYPYVRHGDRIKLIDKVYPERNGVYTVKSVKYYGGSNVGLRQDITIDYRIGNEFVDAKDYKDPEKN